MQLNVLLSDLKLIELFQEPYPELIVEILIAYCTHGPVTFRLQNIAGAEQDSDFMNV